MQALLQRVIDGISEDFGHPASLRRVLSTYPGLRVSLDDPALCISAYSVPRWHELGEYSPLKWPHRQRGFLSGWRVFADQWLSFDLIRPEYAQISHCQVEQDWRCDVTDIDGFSASKADLQAFSSTDAMAEARCQWLISEITPERLAKSLAHSEIRILHDPRTSDCFTRFQWDGRLWLMNDGGSHHTAAAKYLAAGLGQPVPLVGTLRTHSLNALAVASLRRDFEMFAIGDEDAAASNAFFDAMRAFRATWLWHPLPSPFEQARVILLPKGEARSMRAATELRDVGIIDFGAHLASLCARQV